MIVRTLLQLNSAANETMLDFEFIKTDIVYTKKAQAKHFANGSRCYIGFHTYLRGTMIVGQLKNFLIRNQDFSGTSSFQVLCHFPSVPVQNK